MMRVDGWERRLTEVLETARSRPYEIGHWDCFRMACETVAAITGRPSRWAEWEGKYRDERSAVDILKQYGGFMKAFSLLFEAEPIEVKQARRGDICVYRDMSRMRHLGVCVGQNVALLGTRGLEFIPTTLCLCAWRID
jgi:hypothetical protein